MQKEPPGTPSGSGKLARLGFLLGSVQLVALVDLQHAEQVGGDWLEKQPAATPAIMGRAKDTTVSMLKMSATMNTTTKARKVHREVSTVRLKVWFMLRLRISS